MFLLFPQKMHLLTLLHFYLNLYFNYVLYAVSSETEHTSQQHEETAHAWPQTDGCTEKVKGRCILQHA